MEIENKLKEKIRKLVNEGEISEDIKEWNITLEEAKGVSYEVENEVKKIVSELQIYVNNIPIDYTKNNFQIKRIETEKKVFGLDINFKITFYFFKNNDVYVQNQKYL